jgi:hypothetical protein
MTPHYPDSLTLAEARSLFFARSGLGEDGGYNARWVRVETKPFPVYFPNTARRVEAAKRHDPNSRCCASKLSLGDMGCLPLVR